MCIVLPHLYCFETKRPKRLTHHGYLQFKCQTYGKFRTGKKDPAAVLFGQARPIERAAPGSMVLSIARLEFSEIFDFGARVCTLRLNDEGQPSYAVTAAIIK